MAKTRSVVLPRQYAQFVRDLKKRVAEARLSAARAVNRDLIHLYWDVGKGIAEKQEKLGWGKSIVDRLAKDLKTAFPAMRGFSPSNLWRMRQFFLTLTAEEFLAQAVRDLVPGKKRRRTGKRKSTKTNGRDGATRRWRKAGEAENLAQLVRDLAATVPWGHHEVLIARAKSPAEHIYYLRSASQMGWSRNVLLNQVKAGAYGRAVTAKKTHNFNLALPQPLSGRADAILTFQDESNWRGLVRIAGETAEKTGRKASLVAATGERDTPGNQKSLTQRSLEKQKEHAHPHPLHG